MSFDGAGAMKRRGAARAGRHLPGLPAAGGRTSAGSGSAPRSTSSFTSSLPSVALGVLSVPRLRNAAAPADIGVLDGHVQRRLAVACPTGSRRRRLRPAAWRCPSCRSSSRSTAAPCRRDRAGRCRPCAAAAPRRRPRQFSRAAYSSGVKPPRSMYLSAARGDVRAGSRARRARALTSAPFEASSFDHRRLAPRGRPHQRRLPAEALARHRPSRRAFSSSFAASTLPVRATHAARSRLRRWAIRHRRRPSSSSRMIRCCRCRRPAAWRRRRSHWRRFTFGAGFEQALRLGHIALERGPLQRRAAIGPARLVGSLRGGHDAPSSRQRQRSRDRSRHDATCACITQTSRRCRCCRRSFSSGTPARCARSAAGWRAACPADSADAGRP